MSTSQEPAPDATATDPREPNAADAQALAAAGANAASSADPGTSPAAIKRMVREAVKEEADERNLKGFGDAEAGMIAAAVVSSLEKRGAFNDPTPEPVQPPAQPQPGNQEPASNDGVQQQANPDDVPRKKTLAERMLRG